MAKDDKLNLIIMRDDSRVLRYRLRVSWFRFFIYAQVVLLLMAGLGTYGAVSYWLESKKLAQANTVLAENVVDIQMKLERLQNIEKILHTNDPEDMQGLFSSVVREKHEAQPSPLDLQEIFVAKDLHKAGVSNLQLRRVGDDLRLNFELNNLIEGTLSGLISVYIISRDASVIHLQGEDSELRFEIQRFRRVNSMLYLPSGIKMEDIFAMRLVIATPEGDNLFVQTYPLANILTS